MSTISIATNPTRIADAATTLPTAVSIDLLAGAPRLMTLANVALVALVCAFIAWAALASLEEVTVGQGKVVPASHIQLVQSLEGGIVAGLHVKEGDLVEAGALLVNMDKVGLGSNLDQEREKIAGLRYARARFLAEANGTPLVFPPIVPAKVALEAQQRAEFEARQAELAATLSAIDQRIAQRRQEVVENEARLTAQKEQFDNTSAELALTEPLVSHGAAAKVDVMHLKAKISELSGSVEGSKLAVPRLRAAIAEAESERSQHSANFRAEALKELNQIDVEIATRAEGIKSEADKVARTDLRAPVRGLVQSLHVSTIGQVVKPGQDIVEIVPVDDTLLIEARVATRDVAFLKPDQEANVKISAYEYAMYGTLKGRLERISPDAVSTEKGESYYVILLRTDRAYLEKDGRHLPIIPGMAAEVDMLTGQHTVLQYLIRPFTRLRSEALRER